MDFKEIIIGICCLPAGIYIIYKNWPTDIKKEESYRIKSFFAGLTLFLIGLYVIFKMLMTL